MDGSSLAWFNWGAGKVIDATLRKDTGADPSGEIVAYQNYNCYGFAFNQSLQKYQLLIGDGLSDGSLGAGEIVKVYFDKIAPPTDADKGVLLMYFPHYHVNYIYEQSDGQNCYRATAIKFKDRTSQIFDYAYENPRPWAQKWKGYGGVTGVPEWWDPEYYIHKP
jgi:hypothetical protein